VLSAIFENSEKKFLNWPSLGKMRKHCGMIHHQSNVYCKVQSLIRRVKCDCIVQRIGTNTLQTIWLHQST